MTINVLFSGNKNSWPKYRDCLNFAFKSKKLKVVLKQEFNDPALVDYIIYAPSGPFNDFSIFPNVKAVLSLWAGVESIVLNPTLTQPLCRMVDEGLTNGMVEYIVGHTLRYHLGLDQQISQQDGVWRHDTMIPALANERNIGIIGLGSLGLACAQQLNQLNFNVSGWSRRKKKIKNISCFSGQDGFDQIISTSDILILLLPLTYATKNLINEKALSKVKRGVNIINAGRGALIDDIALISAIDCGQVAGATLDVFKSEPLPSNHIFWKHEKITVTPHIAAETRPETSSISIAVNIFRCENNLELLNLVDRVQGY